MNEEERAKEIARLTELLERPRKANIALRALYKWFLEFLGYCLVVAALVFLARKSGDWWLYGIAIVGGFALAGYCYTYIENAWPEFDLTNKSRLRKHATIWVSVIVLQAMLIGITVGVQVTLDKVVKIEGETAKAP
jgi:hypothetical protein